MILRYSTLLLPSERRSPVLYSLKLKISINFKFVYCSAYTSDDILPFIKKWENQIIIE